MKSSPEPVRYAESVQFGILLNDVRFYSSQLWIANAARIHPAVLEAWRQLRMQARRLTWEPLKADLLDRMVHDAEEELCSTVGSWWHLESARDLCNTLRGLPDDGYYLAAEDELFRSFLRPIHNLREKLLQRIDAHLAPSQVRSILLGAYLCSLVRSEQVWTGMYAAAAARAPQPPPAISTSAKRVPTLADFGLDQPLPGRLPPIDEAVRDGLPSELIDCWPVRLDEHETKLLESRFRELEFSWELARGTLLETDRQTLVGGDLTKYVDALRNAEDLGQATLSQQEGYLGIRFEDMKMFTPQFPPLKFGKSIKAWELAKWLVAAGERGRSRDEVKKHIGEEVTPNAVDQAKRTLNKFLRKVDLIADFFERRYLSVRRRKRS